MLLSLTPLFRHRELRLLYFGEFASALGSMLTVVALPYQIFHLTRSSLAVGLIGVAQLVPLLLSSLIGGAYADATDRRKLLLYTQLVLLACAVTFALNSLSPHPQLWLLYLVAAVASAANGFHGPTLQAMMPRLVTAEEIPALGVLNSLKGTASMVAGPAIGGILIAKYGLATTYWIDALTFLFFLGALLLMQPMPASEPGQSPSLRSIGEGLRYAASRQDLIGTYVVDIVAMIFGSPMALMPEIAEHFGGAAALGWLYAMPSVGAFLAAVFSGWTHKVTRHGAAIAIAAAVWGGAITAFGFSTWLPLALFFLMISGAADMISGLFRMTIWNTTIPDQIRGRLAGIEMLSYMSGPLLGNAESGLVSALAGTQFAVVSGGLLCIVGVYLCVRKLPLFWSYDFRPASEILS
ncbi:MAG: MFS transporter [Chthoniobacter sp.]|uniref:MFS transporter n=1 Tax=Chthoniobacter sp. TaxID=2510640 RepID=UPI0032A1EA33